jgi:hypothetical protein
VRDASNRLMGAGMFVASLDGLTSFAPASRIVLSKCCSCEAAASYRLVTPGTASVESVEPKAQRSAFLVTASRMPKAQQHSVSRVSSPGPKVQRLASLVTGPRVPEGERSVSRTRPLAPPELRWVFRLTV